MSRPRMRPRFRVSVPGDAEAARRRIERAMAGDDGVKGGRIGPRLELTVMEEERHYWSPHLCLALDESDGEVVVEGRFGPHPHVWTLFMALYAHVVFVGIGGAMYGTSQWILGQPPWALLAVPIAALLAAIVYVGAFWGQGLGGDQMYRLRSFVEDALNAVDAVTPAAGSDASAPSAPTPSGTGRSEDRPTP